MDSMLKRGCFTLRPKVLGARVHIHWSVFLAIVGLFALWIRHPAHAAVVIVCYLGLILLHEAGHVWVARRLGYQAENIYLGILHGVCEVERPDSRRDHALIAWGGVALQLLVAVPLIALSQFTPLLSLPFAGIVVATFGYVSLLTVAMNLVPTHGVDGAFAWKIVPILLAERRERARARKTAEALFRRLK